MRPIANDRLVACLLFVALLVVYWYSVPDSFNTTYENRRFFDSDGEFITRQFKQGSSFTHNDHLLYHVLARLAYDALPKVEQNAVTIHKALSALSGAIGGALLFLLGKRAVGRTTAALACALVVAGSAGWWYFSATIDTYMPSVLASILALAAAHRCLQDQRTVSYVVLGSTVGLAFLFRTDGFLLAILGIVVFGDLKRWVVKLGACASAAIIVGVFGYAALANHFYGVAPVDVPAWSMGFTERPEAADQWGVISNLTWANFLLTLANQTVYVSLLPGLTGTRSPDSILQFPLSVTFYVAFWMLISVLVTRNIRTSQIAFRTPQLVLVTLSLLWIGSRTLFYTWWDPFDPFLFAVMSLPAAWLLVMVGLQSPIERTSAPRARGLDQSLTDVIIWIAAAGVWIHNWVVMITPLRRL